VTGEQALASPSAGQAALEWYDDPLPSWLGSELVALHGNVYSTLPYIRLDNPGSELSAFVLRSSGTPTQIIVFSRTGGRTNVLNAVNKLSGEEIGLFSAELFARYPQTSVIVFPPSHADVTGLSFPHQLGVVQEDIVVTLPDTVAAYRIRLRDETSRHLKRLDYYQRRLSRDYPSYAFSVRRGTDVPDEWVGEIVRLNRARMAAKHKASGIDDENERRMLALVSSFGVVGVATIEGRIAAGTIGYRVGNSYFLRVIAHDRAYDHLSLGRVCVYRTICDSIEHEASEFHFLWGEDAYKYTFLGEKRDLFLLNVYRSRLHALRQAPLYASTAKRLVRRRAKPWVAQLRRMSRRAIALRKPEIPKGEQGSS
jgi:CelD/BcsL family acetyltransferase involved in cellulose biosynthesis